MLKLFYSPGACSLASHIALEEAGADYEAVRVDLKAGEQNKPEYRKLNPKGRVPALATDRGVLTESPVILGYIAQTHPAAKLAPNDDSFAFGDMQAFNMFLATSVHVAFAHAFRPERYVKGEAGVAAAKAKVAADKKAADTAKVTAASKTAFDKTDAGPTVTASHLEMRAKIPGVSQEAFDKAASEAKAGCPISRLLNTEITLDATLEA